MGFRPPYFFDKHPFDRSFRRTLLKMGPWHHWGGGRWGHHFHRGPSRLLWFVLGAGVATWWTKSRECREYRVKHCMRSRIPPEAYPAPASAAVAATATAAPDAQQAAQGQPEEWHWHGRRWEWSWPPSDKAARDGWGSWPPAAAPPPGAPTPGMPPKAADGWEDETARLQKMTTQATETLAEISEAGLDSLLSTVESLKGKIVERREQRAREQAQKQAQQAEQAAQREERFKQFEEWQKQQQDAEKKTPRLV